MKISTEAIKEIRERTGCGMLDCRNALLEAEGNLEAAMESLRQRGVATAQKRGNRVAREGVVEAYVHHNGRIGALVELNCESDFVARTDEFRQIGYDLAMQVAATSPQFITEEEMPVDSELDPQEVCLLLQPFVKEPSRTVGEVITEAIARTGENIGVRRFSRFELGC
jgi:elongation factor Ts